MQKREILFFAFKASLGIGHHLPIQSSPFVYHVSFEAVKNLGGYANESSRPVSCVNLGGFIFLLTCLCMSSSSELQHCGNHQIFWLDVCGFDIFYLRTVEVKVENWNPFKL